jgi:hypothetical protein
VRRLHALNLGYQLRDASRPSWGDLNQNVSPDLSLLDHC